MMVFAAVAEAGSFTHAAHALGLGRARVSQIVRALELRLGVKLLNRTTRSVSLTEVGAQYFDKCRLMAELGEDANAMARAAQETVGGVLRIKLPIAGGQLVSVICAFMRENPAITVELIESDTPVNMVAERVDVAFASGTPEDITLRAMPLGSVFEILVAAQGYIAQHGAPETPEDLRGLDWVCHTAERKHGKITLRRMGHPHAVLNQPAKVVAGSAASIARFVREGAGFAILPSALVAEDLASGAMVRILPEYHGFEIPISALYGYQNMVPLKVQAFLDFVKANLELPAP